MELNSSLLVDDEQPDLNADFILFRDRNPEKAKAFEKQGFRFLTVRRLIRIANNKWLTYQLALVLGIPSCTNEEKFLNQSI